MIARAPTAGALARGVLLLLATAGGAACGGVPLPRAETVAPAPPHEVVDPDAIEAFLRASLLSDGGYHERAAGELRRAIRADPDAPTLHLALAEELSYLSGTRDEGLMACDLARDLDAAVSDVALCRGRVYVAAGEPESAAAVYRAVPPEAADPRVFESWLRLAPDLGDDAVVEAARAFATAFPSEAKAWRALGGALADSAPLEAADAYGWAVRLPDPDPADAYQRVRLLAEAEHWDDALEAANDCRDRFWEYWPCSSWQAVLHDRGRAEGEPLAPETIEALEHLAFMVSVDPRQIVASGAVLEDKGSASLASAYALIVADTRPSNASVVTAAAWVAAGPDDDRAVELMQRVLALDDANFDALNFIGYTWADRGQNLEQAEEYIRRALFLRGDDGNILDSLAWVQFRMGRFDEALETQLRAVALVQSNAVLWDHLGDIYFALDRVEDAVGAWTRALDFADERDEDVLEDAPRKIREAGGEI